VDVWAFKGEIVGKTAVDALRNAAKTWYTVSNQSRRIKIEYDWPDAQGLWEEFGAISQLALMQKGGEPNIWRFSLSLIIGESR